MRIAACIKRRNLATLHASAGCNENRFADRKNNQVNEGLNIVRGGAQARRSPPTGGETGARNFNLSLALGLAARRCSLPLQLFDSSTGFRLADGSVLSPDLSVVTMDRWQTLTPEQRRTFPPLCPDLVIELASASDEGPRGAEALRRKMALYQANGAQLGWLLFPEQRAVEIWPARPEAGAASAPQRLENATRLDGGAVLPGLVLELEEIWAG